MLLALVVCGVNAASAVNRVRLEPDVPTHTGSDQLLSSRSWLRQSRAGASVPVPLIVQMCKLIYVPVCMYIMCLVFMWAHSVLTLKNACIHICDQRSLLLVFFDI
jgi:hypothetical protein